MTSSTSVLPAAGAGPGLPLLPAPSRPPVDPLPLPQPGWGSEQAGRAVAEAALVLPALTEPPQLVRALSTVVFRVGAHAVKVHPPGTGAAHLSQVHRVLSDGAPVVAALAEPVVTSHGVVTVTPWVAPGAALPWDEVGAVLRALHDLPTAGALPPWTPLRRLPAQLEHLPSELAGLVHARRSALLDRLAALTPVLPAGAVHGDVSPENVLRTPAGPRWIDLDLAAHGLREYDLAAVVRRHAAGEVSDRDYRRFVAGYGVDLRGWPGLDLIDELCRLSGIGFRLWLDRRAGCESGWLPEALSPATTRTAGAARRARRRTARC